VNGTVTCDPELSTLRVPTMTSALVTEVWRSRRDLASVVLFRLVVSLATDWLGCFAVLVRLALRVPKVSSTLVKRALVLQVQRTKPQPLQHVEKKPAATEVGAALLA
jgi:hypothetical protein